MIVISFYLGSCSSATESQITIPDGEKIEVSFEGVPDDSIKNPELTVTLFGQDKMVADLPATELYKSNFHIKEFPATVQLTLPDNAIEMIKPRPTSKENISYHIYLSWDSNTDGEAGNKGDIVIDYDRNFPEVTASKKPQTVFLKILK